MDNDPGSANNPILIENDTPFTKPYASPPSSPDDLTSANLHLHYRPPNPLAQTSMASTLPLIDLDSPSNQPSTSFTHNTTTTSHRSSTKTNSKAKRKRPNVRPKKRKTTVPSRTHSHQPKVKLGLPLPLHPQTNPLILSTKGPHQIRFFACHPSPGCFACKNIISHYNKVKASLHRLEIQLSPSCRARCDNARDSYMEKNYKNIEQSTTTFLEKHFRTHHDCGTIMDTPHPVNFITQSLTNRYNSQDNQLIIQPLKSRSTHSVNQSVANHHPINQLVNEPINQSISRQSPFNQSISQ